MKINKEQMKKMLTTQNKFSQLSLNMLLTRLTGMYQKNATETVLQQCTQEMNVFFEKYQSILQKDFEVINRL